ncbi:SLOG domain-containing protein [Chitinophaga lutea]
MIFLSASIPLKERDTKYFETADVISIRDAVRALATVVIPHTRLIWGGHPSINPLIRYVLNRMNFDVKKHVTIYMSNYFRDVFPPDVFDFEDVKIVDQGGDRETSLRVLRNEMIRNNDFSAGVFIGGMEGVEQEFSIFKEAHPNAIVIPLASTGAAAKLIYEGVKPRLDKRLLEEYAYMSLFKDLLKDILIK